MLIEIVKERWLGPEFLLEDEDAFVFKNPADAGILVEDIAKHARTRGAGLEASGQLATARAVQTIGALLNDTYGPHSIAQIALVRIDFFGWHFGLFPIETPSVIGAGGFAVSTSNAPVVVNDDDTIFLFPRGLHRANIHARWLVALLALNWQVEFVVFGNNPRVGRRTLLHIHRAFWHLDDADVGLIR